MKKLHFLFALVLLLVLCGTSIAGDRLFGRLFHRRHQAQQPPVVTVPAEPRNVHLQPTAPTPPVKPEPAPMPNANEAKGKKPAAPTVTVKVASATPVVACCQPVRHTLLHGHHGHRLLFGHRHRGCGC